MPLERITRFGLRHGFAARYCGMKMLGNPEQSAGAPANRPGNGGDSGRGIHKWKWLVRLRQNQYHLHSSQVTLTVANLRPRPVLSRKRLYRVALGPFEGAR